MNEWRRRNRTPDPAIRRSGERAIELRTQAQVIKNYNTQTAYESLEDPKKGSRQGRGHRPGCGARKEKKKEISEAKIVRKWFGTWFSHDRHTCPFLCVCVSGLAGWLCMSIFTNSRYKTTYGQDHDRLELWLYLYPSPSPGRHEREKQRAVSVSHC